VTPERPPFGTAILKLTAVCNLDCDYCYVFNLADRTHTRVPALMAEETAVVAVESLAEQMRARGGARINVVLHGGEPTLWPLVRFRRLLAAVEEIQRSGLETGVSLQTNGVRLREDLVELLRRHEVTLGFSLDGPEEINDRHRVSHSGAGSYRQVMANMERVLDQGYDPRWVGVLSVADPELPPAAYLEWAAALPVRNVSLLWPIEFSWSNPPWGSADEAGYALAPRYGSWLAEVFELWWASYADRLYVREFQETIGRFLGDRHHSDSIGNDAVDMYVVNTDGGIEYPDYLRAHRDGGARTRFTVDNDLGELAGDPVFDTLLSLRDHLPVPCASCPYEDVCGGGFIAGRSRGGEFAPERRSVLCYDQYAFFERVAAAVVPYAEAIEAENAEPLARL
jgi:uncharacterized protein